MTTEYRETIEFPITLESEVVEMLPGFEVITTYDHVSERVLGFVVAQGRIVAICGVPGSTLHVRALNEIRLPDEVKA